MAPHKVPLYYRESKKLHQKYHTQIKFPRNSTIHTVEPLCLL